ncbi:MAG TPA: transcriptional repressor LexA [Armatimonadota bacterium]|nr:transcriptional repressor LexA [Armatimonadota bacterium]HOM83803.1 transcriptional repressor LexA [Armatimonadota bacterium]HPO73833.1 transcriptional repressor LexA [Armatimonadota bacterium]HPT99610.1 transcriptional repressor LexA [Armatimonadota bacterium]
MSRQGETRARVFEFLCGFTRQHHRSPTVREIGRALGLRSSETVHRHLVELEREGKIRRISTPNSFVIEILDAEELWLAQPASVAVPLVGRVAAGAPLLAAEHREAVYALPKEWVGEDPTFMLRVRGESMIEAGIFDGDYVIARKEETARDGDMVVALVDGEEATVKYFFREPDRYRLEPANQAMAPIYSHDVRILGKVIWVVRRVG